MFVVRKLHGILHDLNIQSWIGPNAIFDVQLLHTVRDWKGWLLDLAMLMVRI